MSSEKNSGDAGSSFNRRDFLKAATVGGLLSQSPLAFGRSRNETFFGESRGPISSKAFAEKVRAGKVPYSGLVTSLTQEPNYECLVEGVLPNDLSGTLLRNGPGIFDRGEMRRRIVIDGDGMLRKFTIANGKARFASRHIRTEKFKDEEKANKYLYPSFAMHIPSFNPFANSLTKIKNQASVTTFVFGGRLFATDEMRPLTELDPETLATLGEVSPTGSGATYMAHTRITHFGSPLLHLASLDVASGKLSFHVLNERFEKVATSQEISISRSFHDWHVTPDFYVIALPPQSISKAGLAQAMGGFSTIADATVYDPTAATEVVVIPRSNKPVKVFHIPIALSSWHSVGAFQQDDGQIVFDFIASEDLSSSASDPSAMAKIMRGELEQDSSLRPSVIYRTVIDYENNKAAYKAKYFDVESVEMPTLDQRLMGLSYGTSYFVGGQGGLDTQVIAVESKSKKIDRYDFGPSGFVTEPIFAPSKSSSTGYLLSEVYSAKEAKSYLAVLKADELAAGPIAKVWLTHHLPLGFHGFWQQG